MTLVYLNRTVLQVPDVGRPVQGPLEPSCVRLGKGVDTWVTLVYLNISQVPDVGRPVQGPLEPSWVWLGGGGRYMDDPCILKQECQAG